MTSLPRFSWISNEKFLVVYLVKGLSLWGSICISTLKQMAISKLYDYEKRYCFLNDIYVYFISPMFGNKNIKETYSSIFIYSCFVYEHIT